MRDFALRYRSLWNRSQLGCDIRISEVNGKYLLVKVHQSWRQCEKFTQIYCPSQGWIESTRCDSTEINAFCQWQMWKKSQSCEGRVMSCKWYDLGFFWKMHWVEHVHTIKHLPSNLSGGTMETTLYRLLTKLQVILWNFKTLEAWFLL